MVCKNCEQVLGEGTKICPICKTPQEDRQDNMPKRSRWIAGLLQIFLGGFGLGRFYLGYNGMGLAQLFTMPILFIGNIWGIIDGILILCGQITCDADGIPLQ